MGEVDPEGRVKITDRKKEIIVTNGGKNVAPQPLENDLRPDLYIEQAVVVGDHRNHLAALIVPHFPALRAWCRAQVTWPSRTTPKWWRTPGWWPSS